MCASEWIYARPHTQSPTYFDRLTAMSSLIAPSVLDRPGDPIIGSAEPGNTAWGRVDVGDGVL